MRDEHRSVSILYVRTDVCFDTRSNSLSILAGRRIFIPLSRLRDAREKHTPPRSACEMMYTTCRPTELGSEGTAGEVLVKVA